MQESQVPKFGSDRWYLDASLWYDMMRHKAPVFFSKDQSTWHVFRYADVERVLTQFSTFSSAFGGGYDSGGHEGGSLDAGVMESMLMTDPPLHTKLRNVVAKSFSPPAISLLEPRIREIASGLIAEFDESKMDFVSEFADPFPVTVISEMLGIPIEDRKKFKRWSDNEIGSLEGGSPAERAKLHHELAHYFIQTIEERKKNPRSDLISTVVTSEVDGMSLNEREILSFCILLLIAGNETTTNLLGNAIRLFARYNTLAELRAKPQLITSAVEEVLRYSSPVRAMFRVAVKDADISGQQVESGQTVLAWIGSANRDEAKFSEPEKFDVSRKSNPHIAFGHGIHMCLGAPLARLESKVALQLISEKYRNVELRVSEDELTPIRSVNIGGVRHLPVRFAA